jgi:hypothetical protein
MLNAQSITAVALDTLGANGLDTQSTATALSNTWFTQATNISYTEGGKVSFRKGSKQATLDAGNPIGSLVEYKDASSTKLFVCYGGTIARLELTERDDAFKAPYTPADVVTSDWYWVNFNNKLIGVQDSSIRPIMFDGSNWEYLEDTINTGSTGTEVDAGDFNIGTRYKISNVTGDVDWSSVGGSATASVDDIFTATADGSGITGTSSDNQAYEGGTFPEGVSTFDPSCSLGYYGRLWVGGITSEKDVLHYSSLLDESKWWTASGITDAGYIDLKTVWGKDEIVAIHSFTDKLVIFGKDNIIIYNDAAKAGSGGMYLDEVIRGIGCVSRDSIQAVADDLIFLSATGVRSLTRTAEFDKLPLKDISLTIKDELISNIKSKGLIKSVYMADEGLYLLSFIRREVVYVFDLNYTTERGTPRITKWAWSDDRTPHSLVYSEQYGLLIGQQSGRVATYEGYWDTDYSGSSIYTYDSYKGSIATVWIDLGQGVSASILKKILFVISGGQGTQISLRAYKDFSMTPILSNTFEANPILGGVPFKWSSALTTNQSLYGCNTDYDYGWSGFCSSAAYSSTTSAESLMEYRNQSDCQAASTGNVWNNVQVTSGTIAQPANCTSTPAKFAPRAGFEERSSPLASTAKYLRIELDGLTSGYEASLQSISLLYKQGKTL